VPEEANGRGLREAGCLPGVGPGLRDVADGRDASGIRDGLAEGELGALLLAGANPVRSRPDAEAWRAALSKASFVVSIAMFDDESTRYADVVLPAESYAEQDGTVTHPDGRLQRLRPNVPLPGDVRPVWRVLTELGSALGLDLGFERPQDVFAALCAEVPFYEGMTYEEIGGTGVRWQERSPGRGWGAAGEGPSAATPPLEGRSAVREPSGAAARGFPAGPPSDRPTTEGDGLLLGTYRDLWASEVTERNPALRFLMPAQRLELAPKDAEALGLGHGDAVTVSADGTTIEARVAIRERMRPGAAFLIEGTSEQNANLLANGGPRRIEVAKATPATPGREAEEVAE
jgi:NADH-quinone oxidoreductase subunit G